jgi:hypothetical protein
MRIEDERFPICERCWISANSNWEADSVDDTGNIITRLTKIAVPLVLDPGTVHSCVLCEKVTVVGLFITFDELDALSDEDTYMQEDEAEYGLGEGQEEPE